MKPKDVPGITAMVAACWDRRAWSDLRDYLRRIRWREALQHYPSRSTIKHQIVVGLLILGSWYRRVKSRLRPRATAVAESDAESGA
jgi:hypothetical protein